MELQIKSTEYKAVDDTKLKEGEGGEEGEEEDKEEEVEGFVFRTLRSRLGEDKEDKLAEFKQHLLDQNNAMAPMKVWERMMIMMMMMMMITMIMMIML